MDANQNNDSNKKTYHKKATGAALKTVEKHSADHELKLFGSCFCIVPGFYRYLQAQDEKAQIENAEELKEQISKLVDAADKSGPFFLGDKMTFVDVQMAPWVVRLRKVLQPYRGWPEPEAGSRWAKWVDAIEQDHAVRATTSTDELYLDSYERYAENRPNTSQVQRAINSGRGLP
ncbi:unnamed protein product [Aureobasidium pullulans]|nr:unnamed protein product [Aureobasidium pullulans]